MGVRVTNGSSESEGRESEREREPQGPFKGGERRHVRAAATSDVLKNLLLLSLKIDDFFCVVGFGCFRAAAGEAFRSHDRPQFIRAARWKTDAASEQSESEATAATATEFGWKTTDDNVSQLQRSS